VLEIVSVNFSHALCFLLDFLAFENGADGLSVRKNQSLLPNIPEECRLHDDLACWPWFGSTWSGSQQSSLAWSSLALHRPV